jgi:Fic family protein
LKIASDYEQFCEQKVILRRKNWSWIVQKEDGEKQMHLVFELQASMNAEESDKTTIKTENRNRNEKNRRQIVDFIADNGISDAKTVSKAIGLKPSRTRDYLKQLVDEGILEVEGEYKSRKYKIKK